MVWLYQNGSSSYHLLRMLKGFEFRTICEWDFWYFYYNYELVMKNFKNFQKFLACSNPILRIPNRRDRDYFDEYVNHSLDETPFYRKLLTGFHRWLYFLSGPNFLVPFIGKCSDTCYSIPVVWIIPYDTARCISYTV